MPTPSMLTLIASSACTAAIGAAGGSALTLRVSMPAPVAAVAPAAVTDAPPQRVICINERDERNRRDEEQWKADMRRGGIPPSVPYTHVPRP